MDHPLVAYLKTHSFKQLLEERGVKCTSGIKPNVFSANYDQVLSKCYDPIVEECRGAVIELNVASSAINDENAIVGDIKILAWPMRRFYNYEQRVSVDQPFEIDRNSLILQKVDGTCIIVYCGSDNAWQIATRNCPDGSNSTNDGALTYRQLFERTLSDIGTTFEAFVNELDHNYTYVFELTAPENVVHISYEKRMIWSLAQRNRITGKETAPQSFYRAPESYQFDEANIDRLRTFVDSFDGAEFEGVVIINRSKQPYDRVKIKNAKYVLAARICQSFTRRRFIECVFDNSYDDVRCLLHELERVECDELLVKLQKLIIDIGVHVSEVRKKFLSDRKGYALWLNANENELVCSKSVYFQMYAGASAFDALRQYVFSDKHRDDVLDLLALRQ
jgi:hypothetical protein